MISKNMNAASQNVNGAQQNLNPQIDEQSILQKSIFNKLLGLKTDSKNFKMGDLSINDEMKSFPSNPSMTDIPENNAIFWVSDTVFDKLEDIESNSKIRNFIEIGDKFYALEDVLYNNFELVEDAIPNNDTTKEKKYFINTNNNGKWLIINEKGQDIIIDVKGCEVQKPIYEKFTEKYKIYDKDIMKDMKLFRKTTTKKENI